MTDNWKHYFCNVNEKLASIFVNIGLRDAVPIVSQPWLLWTWVYFQSPRSDGLSDGKEAPTLFKIEDALNVRVSHACTAIPCGRITTEGRREFYFYGATENGFRKAVQEALTEFEGYKFDAGAEEDSQWQQYLNVLYPSLEDLERIANMDLLEELVKRGDVVTVRREVQHWMSFRSEQSRALFRDAATGAGYGIVGETDSDGEFPFGISVTRTQSVEQNLIDQTVIELLRLCRTFNGDYEGWETPVITE